VPTITNWDALVYVSFANYIVYNIYIGLRRNSMFLSFRSRIFKSVNRCNADSREFHHRPILGVALEDDKALILRQADFCRHHEDRVKESCEAHGVFFKAIAEEPTGDIHQGDAEETHNLIQLDVNAIAVIFALKTQPLLFVAPQPTQGLTPLPVMPTIRELASFTHGLA